MCPRTPYHALSVLCLLSNCLLQEVSADRQNLVPTGTIWSADESDKVPMGILKCRWQFCLAGGALQDARSLLQYFGNFQKDKAVQTEATGVQYGFSGRGGFEHASLAHPEAEAAATLFFPSPPFL